MCPLLCLVIGRSLRNVASLVSRDWSLAQEWWRTGLVRSSSLASSSPGRQPNSAGVAETNPQNAHLESPASNTTSKVVSDTVTAPASGVASQYHANVPAELQYMHAPMDEVRLID
eukprot:636383-Prorocentrum_minimum.AAC.1